jgi:hypothetical protein
MLPPGCHRQVEEAVLPRSPGPYLVRPLPRVEEDQPATFQSLLMGDGAHYPAAEARLSGTGRFCNTFSPSPRKG